MNLSVFELHSNKITQSIVSCVWLLLLNMWLHAAKSHLFHRYRLVLTSRFQLTWYINPGILLSAYKQAICRGKINNFLNSDSSTYSFSGRLILGNSLKSIIKVYISCLPLLGSAPPVTGHLPPPAPVLHSEIPKDMNSLKCKVFLHYQHRKKIHGQRMLDTFQPLANWIFALKIHYFTWGAADVHMTIYKKHLSSHKNYLAFICTNPFSTSRSRWR